MDKLWTKKQFAAMNEAERAKNFPQDFIGQGYGYKPRIDLEKVSNDAIIYIPEFGYEKRIPQLDSIYTKQDFVNLCKEYNQNCADLFGEGQKALEASALFDELDWQYPETLLDEMEEN